MDGAYLAHSVYGFFQNGGALCWIVRVGAAENGAGSRPVAALPAAADKGVETFRAQALPGVDGTIKIDISEEPNAGAGEGGDGKGGDVTYKVPARGPAGPGRRQLHAVDAGRTPREGRGDRLRG
jgi:hypothetical protein